MLSTLTAVAVTGTIARMNKSSKGRVVVLMSGGVDSSVAAALLKEAGYDVIGVYILIWNGDPNLPCPWEQEERDAQAVADQLGIPLHTVNLSAQYEAAVISDFQTQYQAGLTPNPDVLCNSQIKFKAVLEVTRQFEPDFIATGHYAQIKTINGVPAIFKAVDENKDQSYFLWNIDRAVLPKLLFPVGDLTKTAVRALATKLKLPTAAKKDSQGICFLGPVNVRQFLLSRLKVQSGQAVLADGRTVATHQGVQLYTIGQRLGADQVSWSGDAPPLFVVGKDIDRNQLVVGTDEQTYGQGLTAISPNWLTTPPAGPLFVTQAKIRYRQKDVGATISYRSTTELAVSFDTPVRAITPGQSVVFYSAAGQLLGGALIKNSA